MADENIIPSPASPGQTGMKINQKRKILDGH